MGFIYIGPLQLIAGKEDEPKWRIAGPPITPTDSTDELFDSNDDSWGVYLKDWTVARWNHEHERYERPNGLTQTGAGLGLPNESADDFEPGTAW